MRLSADQVKQAILSPDQDVREAAIYYFARSYSPDPGIMPLAIQAVEQYGWDDAFDIYRFMDDLVQTDETVLWLVDQLKQQAKASPNDEHGYVDSIRSALVYADAAILRRYQSEILAVEDLDDDAQQAIRERIWFTFRSPEDLWHDLQVACQSCNENEDDLTDHPAYAGRIVSALARHSCYSVAKVFSTLVGDSDDAAGWLELFAIELAGELRLEDAVPHLITIWQGVDEWSHEECDYALSKIGGDSVVRQLAEACRSSDFDLKLSAATILENIHTDLSVQTCLSLFEDETDLQLRCSLLQSVLMNFANDGIEPARQLILTTPLDPDVLEVRTDLLTCCRLMGETFPEFDAWQGDAKNDAEFRRKWYEEHPFALDDWYDDSSEDKLFEDDSGVEFEDEFGETLPTPTARQERHVGRNDPCPCGSGKKYKKCCLGRQKSGVRTDDHDASTSYAGKQNKSQFPIGTVAFYGPDDTVTTKIVAGIIRAPGTEPLIERWVGTRISESPKVQRQIREFFAQHRIASVAASDGNLGCPHEEGLDFPDGEDCPFCPFWAGKQGSNRRD